MHCEEAQRQTGIRGDLALLRFTVVTIYYKSRWKAGKLTSRSSILPRISCTLIAFSCKRLTSLIYSATSVIVAAAFCKISGQQIYELIANYRRIF